MKITIVGLVSMVAFVALPAAAEPSKATKDDPAVKPALERQAANVDLTHAGELSAPSATPATPSAGTSTPYGQGAREISDTNAHANKAAGATRGVALASGVERPVAGVRALQRMDATRVLASLDTSLRACSQRGGAAASPGTTMSVRLSIGPGGEVERVTVVDRASARDEVAACVVEVASSAKFRAPAGAGASMVVPVVLPAKAASPTASPTPQSPVPSAAAAAGA